MTLQIDKLTLGVVETNCYVVGDPATGLAAIIDPAADAPAILDVVRAAGWKVERILVTHAHFDHVLALSEVKAATNAPIVMHAADLPLLAGVPLSAQRFIGQIVPAPPLPDVLINPGDALSIGSVEVEVRFTPGHTPGHVSYIVHSDRLVFSGDCLFAGSIGRTDLPGGNFQTLISSINEQLLTLPDDYRVLAGHVEETTIGQERATNPFLVESTGR